MARRIDDVGEKVAGLRKDRFKGGLTLDHLKSLSPEEAEVHVTKDMVWPAPDYAALIEDGMDVQTAAFVKVCRDRMATKPDLGRDPDRFATRREEFVLGTTLVRDLLLNAPTITSLRDANATLAVALGVDLKTRQGINRFVEVVGQVRKDRRDPYVYRTGDRERLERMVSEGFPGKGPAWRKGVEVVPLQGRFFPVQRVSKGSGRRIMHADGFDTAESADAWLKVRYEEGLATKAANRREEPDRPHLDAYDRTGLPDHRGGRHVSPEELMGEFGFRGVKFGNYLPDDERQRVVDMGYDALCDLAEVVGIPRGSIGLDGRLAVAFGAMGSGGAAATYHPSDPAINLTRIRGGGSLAHEWGHAFDHWTGEVDRTVRTGLVNSGSGWDAYAPVPSRLLTNLGAAEGAVWDGLMDAVWKRSRTKAEAVTEYEEGLEKARKGYASTMAGVERQMALPPERRDRTFLKKVAAWEPGRRMTIDAMVERLAAMREAPEDAGHGRSDSRYLQEARKLCGPSGEYWKRPAEMFARAFEAHVFDRLAKRGGSSPYLVQGVEGDRFEGERYKGNPYPKGDERIAISAGMDGMLDALRHRLEERPELALAM